MSLMVVVKSIFKKQYQIPIEKENSAERAEKLRRLIAPYILRRTKEQVATDLPTLSTQVFFVAMEKTQKELYEKEKSAVRNKYLKITPEQAGFNVLQSLQRLRQIANHPGLFNAKYKAENSGKFIAVTTCIETLITAQKKVLFFSSSVSHLKLYQNWCKQEHIHYHMLTGSNSQEERERMVDSFQNNSKISLFFISLKAGGTGLNLTATSYVILLDLWWNPFAEKQAIARAHRIGQKLPVHVFSYISKDTLEEKILTLQEKKKGYADSIIEPGKNVKSMLSELEFMLS